MSSLETSLLFKQFKISGCWLAKPEPAQRRECWKNGATLENQSLKGVLRLKKCSSQNKPLALPAWHNPEALLQFLDLLGSFFRFPPLYILPRLAA
jgi:hypothetical protein